ncbi:MAG: protein-disulfide reductase DsbD domain-containing protein [Rhodothermales bacterium]
MHKRYFSTLFVLIYLMPVSAVQAQFSIDGLQPTSSADVVAATVQLPKAGVRAGTAFEMFVVVHVAEGWHVNAHRPTLKYLIGTAFTLEAAYDLHVAETYYPDPVHRRFGFTEDTLVVYEGVFSIILAARAAKSMRAGSYALKGSLRVQACNDQVCLRPSTVAVPVLLRVVEGE